MMIETLAALFMMSSGAGTAALGPEIHCAGQEANLRTYLDMSRILFNELKADRAGEFYAPQFKSHNDDAGGEGVSTYRPEDMAKMWRYIKTVEKDRTLRNNLIICKDDLVMAQVTLGANYVGPGMEGNPPEGRRYEQSAIDIYRFDKNHKVVERWGNNEAIAKIRQLGLSPDLSLQPLKKK